MPRLTEMETHQIGGNFSFQGARIESLGATEYTLVTIAIDVTGSTSRFASELHAMLLTTIASLKGTGSKPQPRAENLLLRVITFSTAVGGVNEVHGFKPLSDVAPEDYPEFRPDGLTPLCDAMYSAVGSTVDYGKQLFDADYGVNGIIFNITDGLDNSSTATTGMIKDKVDQLRQDEQMESLTTILVGINAQDYQSELTSFKEEAGLDSYIDAGDVTEESLAKLGNFVSQSVSAQSQSLGTGGASQNISATI